jgi:eukaryotic-like serine/threonine-protein kinase
MSSRLRWARPRWGAIDIDPAYALAWAGLADVYYQMSSMWVPAREAMPKARAAALRALVIDETLAEAHATLAQIQAQYDWDWTTAERSHRRAVELGPSYAHAHLYYSQYLAEQGRMKEAISEAAEALRLDPLPRTMGTNLAWMYSLARRPDQAIEQYRKTQELDPRPADDGLGQYYEQKGMFDSAITEFLKARALDESCDWCLALLGHAYAVSGKREQARRILEKLLGLSRQHYIDPYYFGLIYVGLGEADKAFEWFEKAYQERSEELLFLKVEPRLDPVRADSRFQSLVRRLGLPP